MTFSTPCFVHFKDSVERDQLLKWCIHLGYYYIEPPKEEELGDKVICDESCVGIAHDPSSFTSVSCIDTGASVELFKALAAMNDDNCREQWFTDGERWGLCKYEYLAVQAADWYIAEDDDMLDMYANNCRKATAEEIVEYFTNK